MIAARAKFYDLGTPMAEIQHPMEDLLHEARLSSGSVGGEHRKDLVEAMKAAESQNVGLSLQAPTPTEAPKKTGL